MAPQQIDLVKATVPVLRENGVALTGYFYNRMLGNNPDLKETFNIGHQAVVLRRDTWQALYWPMLNI